MPASDGNVINVLALWYTALHKQIACNMQHWQPHIQHAKSEMEARQGSKGYAAEAAIPALLCADEEGTH